MDLFTGFFGGFVIFSVIGHVSERTNIPIEWFNQSGKSSIRVNLCYRNDFILRGFYRCVKAGE